MKRILLLSVSLLLLFTAAHAQSDLKHDPLLHPRRAKDTSMPKMPKAVGAQPKSPSISVPAVVANPSAKKGTVDGQLNELQRQNARAAASQAQKTKQQTAVAQTPKADASQSNKAISFPYSGKKVALKNNTSAKKVSTSGSGAHRRVNPGR